MPENKPLIVVKKGALCTLTINNPKKRNALSPDCLADITQAFGNLAQDKDIRVAILRGAGDEAFSAGADITAMPTRDSRKVKQPRGNSTTASEAIRNYPFPVIAMLYGYTLGAGCVLAMAYLVSYPSETGREFSSYF